MSLFNFTAGAFNGLLLGGLYAITALGFSMVFGVLRLVNIPHGEILILGAYLSYFISAALGLDPLLAIFIIAPILFFIGYLVQQGLLNPVMSKGLEPVLLTAFGLSTIGHSLFVLFWSTDTKTIITRYSDKGLKLFGLHFALMYLIAFCLSVVVLLGIHLFITRTYQGKAIRAAAQDPVTAQVMGINVKSVYALTYAIAAGLAAIGGTLIGMIYSFSPASGLPWLLKGFAIVVLGGMGSIIGTLVGGVILGVAEEMGASAFGVGYRDLIGLLIFLVVLYFRPAGLFGRSGS